MSNAPISKNPPLCQGPDAQLRKPRHAIPAGAIDCHCHVFEDQTKYPLVAQRSFTIEKPAASADAEGGVRALAAAGDELVDAIVAWTATGIAQGAK